MTSGCLALLIAPPQPGQLNELWTCAQRADHPGEHNRMAPADGCTAWADHCPRCAEHVCVCP